MPSTSDAMTLSPHTRTTPEEQLAALCINNLERHQRALALIPGTEEVSGGLEYLKDAVWRLAKGEGERGMLGLIGRDERPVEAAELEQVACVNKLSTLNTLILAIALMAESPVSRRPYIKDSPETPRLEENYPVGREAMLEMGVFAHPVVIKGVTNGMVKVRADLLGKVTPGQKAFLNPGHFVVHRVSRSTVMLRPVIA